MTLAPTWKQQKQPLYASALRRTPKDAIGTAYWIAGAKQSLYVKIHADRWLCFGGKTIDACLADYATKPGRGGPATDRLIADAISVLPKQRAGVLHATNLAAATKPAKAPKKLTAKLAPDEQWRILEARGAQVVWRKVAAKDIAAAEKALTFTFPRSYVELVTKHGAPAIGDNAKARGEHLAFAVLTPREVVQHTKELRAIYAEMFEEADSLPRVQKQLDNAVLFQFGRYAGEGYCYLLDTAKKGREPLIGHYHHDYIEELDWKPASKVVFRTLSASTLDAANQIARDLP